jgi:hypothetical protein
MHMYLISSTRARTRHTHTLTHTHIPTRARTHTHTPTSEYKSRGEHRTHKHEVKSRLSWLATQLSKISPVFGNTRSRKEYMGHSTNTWDSQRIHTLNPTPRQKITWFAQSHSTKHLTRLCENGCQSCMVCPYVMVSPLRLNWSSRLSSSSACFAANFRWVWAVGVPPPLPTWLRCDRANSLAYATLH